VTKLNQGKIIILPALRNINMENTVGTLNVAYKDLEENSEDIDYAFFEKVPNELNNIISNIHGESQLIELHALDDKIVDMNYLTRRVDSIKQNCLKLTKTINDIVELRKLEKKQANLYINNVNIVEIIDNIVINASNYINDKVIFDTNIEEKFMPCDINKFQKVMLILLSIAAKYSNKKKVLVNLNVVEDNIIIAITFNNKSHKLLNIFKGKMDNPSIDDLDELSLNLFLCKSLITLHGGSISVRGNADETIFSIELPCENSDSVYHLFKSDIKDDEYLMEQMRIEFSDLSEI
jgi:signal transduction histidine kinase